MITTKDEIYQFHAGHPGFSAGWYLANNPDVRSSDMDAFSHYCNFGASEGRDPSPFFDTDFYLKQLDFLRIDVSSELTPLLHYSSIGWTLGLNPNYLFDTNYYIQGLHDNSDNFSFVERDPLSHFLLSNDRSVNPHPLFDFEWLHHKYPDLNNLGTNAWCHYLLEGWRERRSTHPEFSPQFVEQQIHQLGVSNTSHLDLLRFYLDFGTEIGLEPHRFFDSKFYISQIFELFNDEIDYDFNPLLHFVTTGKALGVKRNPIINEKIWWQRRPKGHKSKYLLEIISNSIEESPIDTHPVLTSTIARFILQKTYNDVHVHP
jgi:hypothetical protein